MRLAPFGASGRIDTSISFNTVNKTKHTNFEINLTTGTTQINFDDKGDVDRTHLHTRDDIKDNKKKSNTYLQLTYLPNEIHLFRPWHIEEAVKAVLDLRYLPRSVRSYNLKDMYWHPKNKKYRDKY